MLSISLVIALLAALALAQEDAGEYLFRMCIPGFMGEIGRKLPETYDPFDEMVNSPFPCEQEIYLSRLCFSNGTTEIDFLAEQQCLCGGNYFEASRGCQECFYAHGLFSAEFPQDEVLRNISRASSAECSATPITVPFTNHFPPAASTGTSVTIISDRFPNDSAVSNYWTGATTPVAGQITGSATARLTSRTNSERVRYTPTGTTETSATEAATTEAAATEAGTGGGGGTNSTNPPSPSSTNGATNVKAAGGLLAVIIGVVAAL